MCPCEDPVGRPYDTCCEHSTLTHTHHTKTTHSHNHLHHPQAKKAGGKAKKPLKGFMLFSSEHRAQIKEENPDLTFGGIGKKLGEMWRGLDEKTKEAYKAGKGKGKK